VTVRRRQCACQQYLTADTEDPEEIVAAVVRDQETAQHRDWWRRQQVIDEKYSIPVAVRPATLRRVS
jgi:hypothetical protein